MIFKYFPPIIGAIFCLNLLHFTHPEPQKIVFKNTSNSPQRVWLESHYNLNKAKKTKPNLERMMCDIPVDGMCSYGSKGRNVKKLEIKFSNVGSNLLPTSSTPVITGLSGVKSIVTISGKGMYTISNKDSFHKKKVKAKEKQLGRKNDNQSLQAQQTQQHIKSEKIMAK